MTLTAYSQVTISIASKDRPDELERTLRKIHAFGLAKCALIVCDDGSQPKLDPPALTLFPRGRLIRNEDAHGQAAARNRIIDECETHFLLQLDDDSYPVSGSLQSLLEVAQSDKKNLALAIPFEEPARSRGFPVGIPANRAIRVQSFVGCSVLFDVKSLKLLGGYSEWIGGIVEEEELSIRAISRGFKISSIDVLRIRHEVSEVSRSRSKIVLRSYRNWFLVWMIYAPRVVLLWRVSRLLFGAMLIVIRSRKITALRGLLSGVMRLPALWSHRTPLSFENYRLFRSLPHPLEFFRSDY